MLIKNLLRFLYVKEKKYFNWEFFLFVYLGLWEFQEKEVIMYYLLGLVIKFCL